MRLSILGLGRASGPELARRRFAEALSQARAAGADHLVLTGDLTEDGAPSQFEVLAEVLADSSWKPHEVTIVPGNHDAYEREDAFVRALRGPLRPYATSSSEGSATALPGVLVVPVSTAMYQPYWRACGRIGRAQLDGIETVLRSTRDSERVVVLAIHHPPVPWGLRLGWLEGLLDRDEFVALLHAYPRTHVLCGHAHVAGDYALVDSIPTPRAPLAAKRARVFLANAVIDHPRPLRLYRALEGELRVADTELEHPLSGTTTDAGYLYA